MKKLITPVLVLAFAFLLLTVSCKKKNAINEKTGVDKYGFDATGEIPFDSTLIKTFFVKHPKLSKYQSDVEKLYRKHQFHYVWFDRNGINEFGNVLYNKINNLDEEGMKIVVPYKNKLNDVYEDSDNDQKPDIDTELLSSALYFFYADKVFQGISSKKSSKTGWYLPRERHSYVNYLDSLLIDPSLINEEEKVEFSQYYLLKDVLKKFRQIEKKGGWKTIALDPGFKSFKPGDRSNSIAQIRQRLFITGDISSDSKSDLYDDGLAKGILNYKKRNGILPNKTILPEHIAEMNVSVAQRIKTITVNMERCRWIDSDITKAEELIMVNVPAYRLVYYKNGKPNFTSDVVVGKALNKTVIFRAPMRYIVFSPYWNVPKNIVNKEILPAIEENPNYLEENNMEWNNGDVRQKPGPDNSLGKVKFMFPNSNAIYLHDTPAKSLFNKEDRAFSHGCIRVAKPKELANLILKNDRNWTPQKIDEAMNSGVETQYTLKNKIPVYIGYFTAWVDEQGIIHFYDDIYNRDALLASLIFKK